MVKTIKTASRGEGKTAKPDFVRWKYTPFGANAPPFPRSNAIKLREKRAKYVF